MNIHDKIELPTLPEPFTYTRPGKSEGALFHAVHMQDYARAAIEADRQARNCGQCVPLSTDGTAVFIDGVGEVPLDFSGQARGNAVASAVSSEPVAWTTPDGREPISDAVKESRPDLYEKNYTVPLFTAPQPQQSLDGYKLVPIEPTEKMLEAGWMEDEISLRQRYKAMLEASPEVNP